MKKKLFILVSVMMILMAGCKEKTEIQEETSATTEEATTEEEIFVPVPGQEITVEQAVMLLNQTMGKAAPNTDYDYTYEYIDTVKVDDVNYLAFDWKWMVDNRLSQLAQLFVKYDGTEIHEGSYGEEGCAVYEKNFYEQ